MTKPNHFWTDAEILEVLHMRDHRGMTAKQIAAATGKTKNAIIGLWHRVEAAMRDDNGTGNGTMPSDWWRRA